MAKLDDIIAKIKQQVEIRHSKAGNLVIDSPQIRAKEVEKKAREGDPAMRALVRASNAKAKEIRDADPYAGWNEIAVVSLLESQVCKTCGETHQHVVGEFLRLEGYTKVIEPNEVPHLTRVLVRRPPKYDTPHVTEHLPVESVQYCAQCLNAGALFDIVIDDVSKLPVKQLRLFS